MQYDLVIRNGTTVSSKGRVRQDVAIRDGRVVALAENISGSAVQELDVQSLYLLPGLIDAHVHFRDPGLTHKEDIKTGSRAALYGGITYVVDMPNVDPVTSTAERLLERKKLADQKSAIDMGFFALLTAENLDEMEKLSQAGAVGYKIYLGTSVGNIAAPPDGVMLEQFRRAAALGMRIGFHAENNGINDYFTRKIQQSKTEDPAALIKARPDFSEVEAVAKAIAYAQETGAKIHIYHVSSGKTVELIRRAKAAGVRITAETCPHYLLLDESDYARLGTRMKVFPTIKTRWDREMLWKGIQDGTIEMIATDHAPHTAEEKGGNIWQAMAGAAGVEISARLMLNAVNDGLLSLEKLVALMSENPARIWNLEGRGKIEVGQPANITVVDLKRQGVIRDAQLHGKSNVTAFDGVNTVGMPVYSVLRGKLHDLSV